MEFSTVRTDATKSRPFLKSAICITLLAALAPLSLLFATSANATALSNPLIGTSLSSFAVLAGSGVTNTGNSVITGDMGLAPTVTTSGFTFDGPPGPGVVHGTVDPNNSAATTAQTDWTTAYNNAVAETPTSLTSATALGNGQTLTAGVYSSTGSIGITGSLTLDGGVPGGVSNSIFVFYTSAGTGLTANVSSTVNLINGAQACDVFWAVGALGATLNGPLFNGTVLSSSAITLDNGETINGRLLASTADVTLQDDTVTSPTCAAPLTSSSTSTVTPSPVPTCTLTSSQISANVGQAVTFDAVISGADPTGTIVFADGPTALGTETLVGGQASLTTTSLTAGSQAIWAYYGGDDLNAGCSFGYLLLTVTQPAALPSATTLPTVTAASTPAAASTPTTIAIPATAPVSKPRHVSKSVTVPAVTPVTPPSHAVPLAPTSPIVPGLVPVTG